LGNGGVGEKLSSLDAEDLKIESQETHYQKREW